MSPRLPSPAAPVEPRIQQNADRPAIVNLLPPDGDDDDDKNADDDDDDDDDENDDDDDNVDDRPVRASGQPDQLNH